MTTYGEISWNDDVQGLGGTERKQNNKDVWLRLEEGSNVVRLLTQPHQYLVHKGIKKEGDKGFGQKVFCSAIHGSCPLCELGLKASPRWLLGVLDRKSNSYKILDISYQVFSQIRKLARKTEVWGDPTKYDIDVFVDKNGGAAGYYSVQPIPHKPLSAADQQLRDSADVDDLKRRVSPPTPENAQKRLDKILGEGGVVAMPPASAKPAAKAATAAPKKAAPAVEMSTEEEESVDNMFPDYAADAQ